MSGARVGGIPRLIYETLSLNQLCRRTRSRTHTITQETNVASPGCYHGYLDGHSAFYFVLLYKDSWALFRLVCPTGLRIM